MAIDAFFACIFVKVMCNSVFCELLCGCVCAQLRMCVRLCVRACVYMRLCVRVTHQDFLPISEVENKHFTGYGKKVWNGWTYKQEA